MINVVLVLVLVAGVFFAARYLKGKKKSGGCVGCSACGGGECHCKD